MQLRWLKVERREDMLDHPNAVLVEGLNGGMYILQAGHWETASQYKDVGGRVVPCMELRWYDITIDKP
jgi:hypothetical protein